MTPLTPQKSFHYLPQKWQLRLEAQRPVNWQSSLNTAAIIFSLSQTQKSKLSKISDPPGQGWQAYSHITVTVGSAEEKATWA